MFAELWGLVTGTSSKLAYVLHSGQFCMLLLTYFGSRGDTNVLGTSGFGYENLVKTHRFLDILASFVCYYSLILGHRVIRTFRVI